MEVGGEAEQLDPAAVGFGVAAGGVEFAPEGPGPPERIAGQGGVEAADGDGRRLQRRDDPAGDEQVSHHSSRTGMPSPSAPSLDQVFSVLAQHVEPIPQFKARVH